MNNIGWLVWAIWPIMTMTNYFNQRDAGVFDHARVRSDQTINPETSGRSAGHRHPDTLR